MPYDMVLGVFDGDWYDASDVSRDWREHSKMQVPPKIKDNPRLPDWYFESSVVVLFPASVFFYWVYNRDSQFL